MQTLGSFRDKVLAPARLGTRERAWAFPVVTLLLMLVLTALDLNGSSVSLLGLPGHDPNLLAGHPEAVRSDEFRVTTPNLIGNARRGLLVRPWIGLTRAFLPATGLGLASAHWTEAFKPQDWGFFLFAPDVAFAFRWWAVLAIGLLGVYGLLLAVTRLPGLSAGLAVFVVLCPYTAWWSNTPSAPLGLGGGAAACAVMGLRTTRTLRRVLWSSAAGYLVVASVLLLYPPWLLAVGIVALAVGIGVCADERVGWRRIVQVVSGIGAVALPSLGLWYLQGKGAIVAIAATHYPGRRVSKGGEGLLRWLLDTPASLWLSSGQPLHLSPRSNSAVGGNRAAANASEVASAWFPLPLLLVAVTLMAWAAASGVSKRRVAVHAPGDEVRVVWTAACSAGGTSLLLAWSVLPIPTAVGRATGLSALPGYRTSLGLGLGGAVLLATVGMMMRRRTLPRAVTVLLGFACLATVGASTWATTGLGWIGRPPPTLAVGALALPVAVAAAVLLTGRRAAAASAVLGMSALLLFLPINPLYRGLGPLNNDPVLTALRPYLVGKVAPRIAVYAGGGRIIPLVSATGLQNLTGLTPYPDQALWSRLAPQQEAIWNNYNVYYWKAAPGRLKPFLGTIRGIQRRLFIDPCAPSTLALHIRLSLSDRVLTGSCLKLLRVLPLPTSDLYLYGSVNRSARSR